MNVKISSTVSRIPSGYAIGRKDIGSTTIRNKIK